MEQKLIILSHQAIRTKYHITNEGVAMKEFICNVLAMFCSVGLILIVLDSTCENNAFSAEIETSQFPEEFLSQEVEWEKCELFDTQKGWRKAECSDITVPLYWESPEDGTITIHVKRLRAWGKATKQMWMLEGGPGDAGTATFPQFMESIARLDWRTDLYTLDHRGTGYSERLGCPDQESDDSEEGYSVSKNEWDACIDHLEENYNLDSFTVTQAAKDVGFLVELLKEENKKIFVYCLSYGTYWGHRYAQVFPDQADAMILDSVLPSINDGFDEYDILANDVLKDFFDVCKEDEFCSSKLGDDPWGKANEIFERFKDGHCKKVSEYGLTTEILQMAGIGLLDDWYLRIALPALYYRLDRCSEEDVNAFKHLMDNVYPLFFPEEVPFAERQFSRALFYHIRLSEEMVDPVPLDVMKEIDSTLLASSHYSYRCLQLLDKWPTFETDMYYRQWVSQDIPILMINGILDHATPINVANNARENLTGPNQYFIEVPNAKHGVVFYNKLSAPVKNIFAPGCGMQIMLDYMEDPLEEPDTSCLADLKPIDFQGNPLMALLLFGTWNLWENNVNLGLTEKERSLIEEELEGIKHNLREQWSRLR